jgi:CRP-like cAMP-binding protein
LLRKGQIGVFRRINGDPTRIAVIDAVNVFGEMALVSGGQRTATIRVLTDEAVVYKFLYPDLPSVLANPVWGELLVKRLTANLKSTSDQLVKTEAELGRIKVSDSDLTIHTLVLITALMELMDRVAGDAEASSRESLVLKGLAQMTGSYLAIHLPELHSQIDDYRFVALRRLMREPGLPPVIRELIAEISH